MIYSQNSIPKCRKKLSFFNVRQLFICRLFWRFNCQIYLVCHLFLHFNRHFCFVCRLFLHFNRQFCFVATCFRIVPQAPPVIGTPAAFYLYASVTDACSVKTPKGLVYRFTHPQNHNSILLPYKQYYLII